MKFLKKVLIAVILLIIIIVVIVIIKKSVNKKVSNEVAQTDEQITQEQIESYSENKTFPRGIAKFTTEYDGNNDKDDFYKSLDTLVNDYLPTLFKDINGLDDAKLSEYFNNKKDDILKNLGINQSDDFVKLAKYLQTVNYENEKFEYCEIDNNSYKTAGGKRYLSFILKLKYENQDEEVQLRVYFANATSTNPEIIYASAE